MKGAAGGMYRNIVAGPLWGVCMTKESDMRCKITYFLKNVVRRTAEKPPCTRGMQMSAIFTTSENNQPIETKSSAKAVLFRVGVRIMEREKEETRANVDRDGRKQALVFFFLPLLNWA